MMEYQEAIEVLSSMDCDDPECADVKEARDLAVSVLKERDANEARNDFMWNFGMSPERAKEILEELRHIVNAEVHEVIAHADFYMNPAAYGYEEEVEKDDEDDDGYTCLYDFGKRSGGAVKAFMELISFHTTHGGHTSAIRACELMGLEWEGDR